MGGEGEFAGYDEWEVAEFRGMSDVERIRYALLADYSDESPANHPPLPLASLERITAALRPFAEAAGENPDLPDDWDIEGMLQLNRGDLRRAAAVLWGDKQVPHAPENA